MPSRRLPILVACLIAVSVALAIVKAYPQFVKKSFRPLAEPPFERFDIEKASQQPQFSDRFEAYAYWWNEGNKEEEDWVVYGEDGKRRATFFYVPNNPPHMMASEAENANLQNSTLVLGVSINGNERAYPIKFLGFELLNDHISGVPIAVSW